MISDINEPIDIDLSRETLRLWICGRCKALVMRDDQAEHKLWHRRNDLHPDG